MNPYENVLTTQDVVNLQQSWRSASYGSTYADPAVVNGVTYAGVADGTLRAFTSATGALRWTPHTGPPSCPHRP